MAIALNDLAAATTYLTNHAVVDLAPNFSATGGASGLFGRQPDIHRALSGAATYNAGTGGFSGTKMNRLNDIKPILARIERYENMAKSGSTGFTKDLEKARSELSRHFGGVVRDVDAVNASIEKMESAIDKDMNTIIKQMERGYRTEVTRLEGAMRTATGADLAARQAELQLVNSKFEVLVDAVGAHKEQLLQPAHDLKFELGHALTDMEKATSLSAAEFKSGSSFASKVTGKEAGAAAKEAGGLKGFITKNPIATALGAVVVGALAMNLLGGSSKESSRA